MSRNNKLRRKEKQYLARRAEFHRWSDTLEQARDLLDEGEIDDARELLEKFTQANPTHVNAAKMLLTLCQEQEDYSSIVKLCQQVLKCNPDDSSIQVLLAGAYLNNGQPMSAIRAFQNFVTRSPDDPLADDARKTLARIEPVAQKILSASPFKELAESMEERLALAVDHEEILDHTRHGRFAKTIELGEALAARTPQMAAVKNNLTDAYFFTGNSSKALEKCHQVLEIDPNNFCAIANQVKIFFLEGREAEARDSAEKLLAVTSSRHDIWVKKCEAMAYLGEDESILRLFLDAQKSGDADCLDFETAMLWHFGAAAAARTGDIKTARVRWRRSLQIYPALDAATDNLDNLDESPSKQNGAWYFSAQHWMPKPYMEVLCKLLERLDPLRGERRSVEAARISTEYSGLTTIIPAMLHRGDPWSLTFAIMVAKSLKTPELLAVLRELCMSQHGPDAVRMATASWLARNGVTLPSPLPFWSNGEWIQTELLDYEVYTEPIEAGYPADVEDWVSDAYQATLDGDHDEAERLHKKCIERVGEEPSLLNNLAVNYSGQGREKESLELLRRIHAQWPDYFFGAISMANLALRENDVETAENYLAPLRQKKRLHQTEFVALAVAYIQLCRSKGQPEAAKSWLNLWKSVDPEDPKLKAFEISLSGMRRRGLLQRLFSPE